jgi:hypothetical protein
MKSLWMTLVLPVIICILLVLQGCATTAPQAKPDIPPNVAAAIMVQGLIIDQCTVNIETHKQQRMFCEAERDYIIQQYQLLYQELETYKREHPSL